LALAVALAMPLFMQSGSLASEVLIFALAAMGCNLLLGYTGLLSFGQGIFFGLGSYTIALTLTRWPLPMPLALALAMAVGALGAAIVGRVAIRQRGTYFVMLTLAFAQLFYFIACSATGLRAGAVTGVAGALPARRGGIAPLSTAAYLTSEMIVVMTVLGGTGTLFASVLGSAFYVLLAACLSSLWPRWLLLLGLVLIAVSL